MTGFLRLWGEARKSSGLPVLAACLTSTALCALMILTSMGEEAVLEGRPTPASLATTLPGALLTVTQQLGTLVGLIMTAIFVAMSTGRELEDGTATHTLLFDPRRKPLVLRKILVSWLYCGPVSLIFVSILIWIIANLNALRLDDVENLSTVSPGQLALSVSAFLLVQAHFTSMGIAIAMWTRSFSASLFLTAGPYFVVMPLSTVASLDPWLPHQWQSALLELRLGQRFIWYVWPTDGEYITPSVASGWLAAATIAAIFLAIGAARGERVLRGGE